MQKVFVPVVPKVPIVPIVQDVIGKLSSNSSRSSSSSNRKKADGSSRFQSLEVELRNSSTFQSFRRSQTFTAIAVRSSTKKRSECGKIGRKCETAETWRGPVRDARGRLARCRFLVRHGSRAPARLGSEGVSFKWKDNWGIM
jgi:hypothetical protein